MPTTNQGDIRSDVLPICNITLRVSRPSYKPYPKKEDVRLGAELKRKRLDLGWTQQQTADHFGIVKDSYQGWEWNKRIPHIKYRKMVNELLGYNFWDDGSNSLANRCLLYRIEKGISREQLGKLLNISEMTIDRIENKNLNISEKNVYVVKRLVKSEV
ncbi:MAG: helix-turn-helix transcriptional regulator [Flavobacteriaceae bacterium]|nr:helix-turn-helix transcriptional regulator [Flavobacteriaceae bacterium]